MEEAEFRKFIEKSIEHTKLDATVDEVVHEFLETVNLIQREGTKYMFVHRSFQEYFAAYCATNEMMNIAEKTLPVFAKRTLDNTFSLAFQMNPNFVVSTYIIPTFNKLKEEGLIQEKRKKSRPFATLAACGFRIMVPIDGSSNFFARTTSWGLDRELEILESCCANVFELEKMTEKLHEKLFQFHTAYNSRFDTHKLPKISAKLTGRLQINFLPDALEVKPMLSKDYKRLPSAITQIQNILKEEALIVSPEINEAYRLAFANMSREVEEQILHSNDNANKLALEFGL